MHAFSEHFWTKIDDSASFWSLSCGVLGHPLHQYHYFHCIVYCYLVEDIPEYLGKYWQSILSTIKSVCGLKSSLYFDVCKFCEINNVLFCTNLMWILQLKPLLVQKYIVNICNMHHNFQKLFACNSWMHCSPLKIHFISRKYLKFSPNRLAISGSYMAVPP